MPTFVVSSVDAVTMIVLVVVVVKRMSSKILSHLRPLERYSVGTECFSVASVWFRELGRQLFMPEKDTQNLKSTMKRVFLFQRPED